ncbi:RNA-directed DNA polymerase, eukaryota, reverse transcriptase zinc-binding domain protein [Tanacetum coccineum]
MVFKVDFEKAFDSLRWDFLDLILEKFSFGSKWRAWIRWCLHNGRSSVLINGSPTDEFELFRGLRQGDPMSLFLFILAMEGLHALTRKAEVLGLFKGASIGQDNMCISHPMYADDVIFFGEWSWVNAHNLISMLRCFYLISGLKINIQKSNVLGIGVTDDEVSYLANIIGCGASQFPMKYLGVPVGCSMTRCTNWNVVVKKFSSKLCSWKARLLSVGGRLSLIKSVLGNLSTYYMSIYMMPVSIRRQLESMRNKFFIGGDVGDKTMTWVKWDKCLASKKDYGLRIGSIYGFNIALLFKWIWSLKRSPWGVILSPVNNLKQQGIDLISLCSRKVGNGIDSMFWDDTWYGEQLLKMDFPRIYQLDTNKNYNITSRVSLTDWSLVLRRIPRGGAEANQFRDLLTIIKGIILSDK